MPAKKDTTLNANLTAIQIKISVTLNTILDGHRSNKQPRIEHINSQPHRWLS
jgi:hypothetical protein